MTADEWRTSALLCDQSCPAETPSRSESVHPLARPGEEARPSPDQDEGRHDRRQAARERPPAVRATRQERRAAQTPMARNHSAPENGYDDTCAQRSGTMKWRVAQEI